MEPVDNNQFEIIPNTKAKRKIAVSCPTAYLNPALDLLANEDPMVNTAMEIVPNKKTKRTKSCEITAFENTALDLGISKAAVNEFLVKELENVRKNLMHNVPDVVESAKPKDLQNYSNNNKDLSLDSYKEEPIYEIVSTISASVSEPILYKAVTAESGCNIKVPTATEAKLANSSDKTEALTDQYNENAAKIEINDVSMSINDKSMEETVEIQNNTLKNDSLRAVNMLHPVFEVGDISNITNIQSNVTNNIFVNNPSNLSLSFIDRLALDSPNVSSQSLVLDDDLNESNIMEIKTITIITKKTKIPIKKKNTNPFLTDSPPEPILPLAENPFLNLEPTVNESEITYNPEVKQFDTQINHDVTNLMPRRLFDGEAYNTVSTVNQSEATYSDAHEYENIDAYRVESPVYENIGDIEIAELHDYENVPNTSFNVNKQSKILGYDVSRFSAVDIMNLNKNTTQINSSNDSNDIKKDIKHNLFKASNKLSKKVFKTLKKKFKNDSKSENNVTLNPYEVPRKTVKKKPAEVDDSGYENPGLNLENSDESDLEDLDEEHQYETIKTLRNTRLNMNVTPLKERNYDSVDKDINISTGRLTPSKKVRFDSTLNQEKVITGNSFDYGIASPGFDVKIDKYQDELENCINEKKIIQQNLN